jgi:hypothetical protein
MRLGGLRTTVAAVALLGLLLLALPAERAAAGEIVSVERDIDNSRERAIAGYWTKRRIRQAEPLGPVPAPAGRGSGRLTRGAPGFLPPVPPGSRAVPHWQSGTVGGQASSQTSGAFVSGPVEAFDTPPNTTAGKVYGRLPGFGRYECSATAVASQNRSLVLTAGHCLGEREYGLAHHVVFIPAFNYEQRPFGTWVARETFVTKKWLKHENFNYDLGAFVVNRHQGNRLHETVGARGFAYNQPREQLYTAIGYPGNHSDAQRMWYCHSAFRRSDTSEDSGPPPMGIGCDMGLGASGGGWIIEGGFANSISSYFYPRNREMLYGPYFGERAMRLVDEAGS